MPRTKGNFMNYGDLTPEQQAKVKACKTAEDVVALAEEEGYELSEAELEAVSGGMDWDCAIQSSADSCEKYLEHESYIDRH